MSIRRTKVPSYRLHKASGQAVVTLASRDVYLGEHGTPASKAEYRRLIAEHLSSNGAPPPPRRSKPKGISTAEVVRRFVLDLESKEGGAWKQSNVDRIRMALQEVERLYGHMPATQFSPLRLQTVRDEMVRSGRVSRKVINTRLQFIRRMFRWAVAQEQFGTGGLWSWRVQ